MQSNQDPTYEEIEAGEPLKHIVAKLWSFSCSVNKPEEKNFFLLPAYSFSLIYIRGAMSGKSEFFLVSPMLKKIKFTFDEDIIMAGALFKPLALNSMFEIDDSVYVNKITAAGDFFGKSLPLELTKELDRAANIEQILQALKDLLAQLRSKYPKPDKKYSDVIEEITNSGGTVKLEDMYEKYSINPRQFQRKFRQMTGLKPKEFIRIVRLSRAASRLVKDGYHHFDVLTEAGYYDQSHYCREFKTIYGDQPGQFENAQKRIKHLNLID